MKDLKIRLWHKNAKRMIYPPSQVDSSAGEAQITLDGRWYSDGVLQDCEYLLFTGLHDKNGKEIWEGDIVKTWQANYVNENSPDIHFFKVVFETECCGALGAFVFRSLGEGFSSVHAEATHIGEIIGNIYENPELIKP